MEPIDVILKLEERIQKIKESLPEEGRRLLVKAYYLPQAHWDALRKNDDFAKAVEKGNPNLGGIPVKLNSDLDIPKIIYKQEEKKPKFYRAEKVE